ncbi:8-amino-7-oxononanoate synthase [wastewater metagenome]|uniref:8-amino-7-oxononanoate synthase n=3 Tax=root TaxID=1 RepID=A0A5B8RB66_9ZZZZ|nr:MULTISPECIES: aminotransferase class I/II-fold pyridoxal phosphate-dependent enzyme [Arhodomonas]MCS4503131.1 aminotransferase class I/II-fold pyridoxal phosphate-dependent enzyme [Arhodomonas aquaeolei]QEA05936.1 8-amino-7-oxononanoate synthase [uncultured organism]
MALLDKFDTLRREREALLSTGIDPFDTPIESVLSPTEARIDGRRVILAGTNNYLGLTFEPECVSAAETALREHGTGTTGSRMANGSYDGHRLLEEELADFYGKAHGMVFSTGYQANLGMLSSLAGPGDVILIDADCHASIYDGCRLSGADMVRFRHNDTASLEKRLKRLGERASRTLIVVEGLYSMLGDTAPLAEIAALKHAYGAYLMVDEAHSLGVYGPQGEGVTAYADVGGDVDFIVGTFSKSLAGIGGFCVSDHEALEQVRYASRPYIFTASPSPSVIASTRAALRQLRDRPELRERLWDNADALYRSLTDTGYRVGPELSPVVAVLLDTREEALALWHGLLENGVYVNLVFPPATPDGKSLVRCSVSAAHTPEQIEWIGEAFASLAEDGSAQRAGGRG